MGTQSPGTLKKTDLLLEGALIRLLERRSFKKISVNDICQEAMVSRSAFYQHFKDKYELLSFCIDKELSLLWEQMRNLPMEQTFENLLQGVQEKQRLIYNMFRAELDQELADIFRSTFQRYIQNWLEEVQTKGVVFTEPLSALTAFLSGGFTEMIISWIRENYRTPREELAACQCALLVKIVGSKAEQG